MHPILATAVTANPTSEGMPGAELIQKLIDWLSQIALWGSLASVLLGAAIYGLSRYSSNYNGADRGRQIVIGGVVGACLGGLAPMAVNLFWSAAGTGA